jgi:hypothetical protein
VEKHGTVGRATDSDIIRRMRFACWVTETTPHTHTHSEHVIFIAFLWQQ